MEPKKSDHSNNQRPPSLRLVDRLGRLAGGRTHPPLAIGVTDHSTETKRETNEEKGPAENAREVAAPAWRVQTLLALMGSTGPVRDQTTRTTSRRKTGMLAQALPQFLTGLEDQPFIDASAENGRWTSRREATAEAG